METPKVDGRMMTISLREFENRALILIADEQERVDCRNEVVGFLCEAVRLVRELDDRTTLSLGPQ